MGGDPGELDLAIADEGIRQFYRYWLGKRGDRRFPSRAALDPLDFTDVLGDVVLIDVRRAEAGSRWPWSFRYRLVGTNVVARDGYDLTRKTLEDLPEPEYRERIRATWTDVCETGIAAHLVRELWLDGRLRRYEVIVLPLAGNGEDIDMLVSVQRPLPPMPDAPL